MDPGLVVVGASGFGRKALDVIEAINRSSEKPTYEIVGILDDKPSPNNLAALTARGYSVIGSIHDWLQAGERAQFIVGVGDPQIRRDIAARFEERDFTAATAVHPNAVFGSLTQLGEGAVVCSGVQVSTNVTLGKHVLLNTSSTIGHDIVIGDFVTINPGAIVSGDVVIEEGSLIGAGAVVLQGLCVGAGATVGASACVVDNVGAGLTVKGVPSR